MANRQLQGFGDLRKAVEQLKREPGKGLFVGGVKLPLALAEMGLIDEYEFVVHPPLAGHGPTLFAGLSNIEHRTSNIEHRTSNIEHRISNIERKVEGRMQNEEGGKGSL